MTTSSLTNTVFVVAGLCAGLPAQAGEARNPVLWADVPDKAMMRVGDTY